MTDNKNTILAIALSAVVLLGWQYFVGMPQMEQQRREAQQKAEQAKQAPAPAPGSSAPAPAPGSAPAPAAGNSPTAPGTVPAAGQVQTRATVLAATPRINLETPLIKGSIALKGARLDDVALSNYHETVNRTSPAIVLLSPSGTEHPFYAEFGWVRGAGSNAKLPDSETVWRREGSGSLAPGKPVTLVWDNGEGLEFRRTIQVDDKYLFTAKDEVKNTTAAPVVLHPYGLLSRHGTPKTEGYYILHEGLIGVMKDKLEEHTYSDIEKKKEVKIETKNGWLGITDKYWAATLLPDTNQNLQARFSAGTVGTLKTYQADYLLDPQTIAPGATGSADFRLFAGAKETAVVDAYDQGLKLNRFELLIDWGWF